MNSLLALAGDGDAVGVGSRIFAHYAVAAVVVGPLRPDRLLLVAGGLSSGGLRSLGYW